MFKTLLTSYYVQRRVRCEENKSVDRDNSGKMRQFDFCTLY